MYYFDDVMDEIERNLTGDIHVAELAKKANMSVYEFRRIFTFITKLPFGEYIRKRRLSLAALELYESGKSVAALSLKYGYDSPSSFSRAFKDFHGISPAEVLHGNSSFKLLTRISAEISTTGGKDISYTVFRKPAFRVSGFSGKSKMTDTECCDDVWNDFYRSPIAETICSRADRIYAVYENGIDDITCYIGVAEGDHPQSIAIPETEWASFKLRGTEDARVNEFYRDILNQWFASSGYSKNNAVPNIEVFPADMEEDDFEWEIWIPIKRKAAQ